MTCCVAVGCSNRAGKPGLSFYRFPTDRGKRMRWIAAVNRGDDWSPSDYSRLCSAHFVSGRRSNDCNSPDYVPSLFQYSPSQKMERQGALERYKRIQTRRAKKRQLDDTTCPAKRMRFACEPACSLDPYAAVTPTSTQTEEIMYSSLDMLATEAKIKEMEEEKKNLSDQLQFCLEENMKLRKELEDCQQRLQASTFDPETVRSSTIKDLFVYYTGLSCVMFMALFEFLVPDATKNPIHYSEARREIYKFSLKQQLFLVLCRLRLGFHLKDIAFRTCASPQTIGTIFSSWIKFMYAKLGFLSFWPHRDVLISQMTPEYKRQFSNSLAIIDATEIRLERPSSLTSQSQCYSDYKSTNTLKSLVVVDSRGSVMFLSELFSGSISDGRICNDSGFYDLLCTYKNMGLIREGDAVMADKGFKIEEPLQKLGLKFNVPPYASATSQMRPGDVTKTRQIAAHRIHVERAINRIKRFQIVGRRLPISLCHQINEIWYVCGMLTNFQDTLVRM